MCLFYIEIVCFSKDQESRCNILYRRRIWSCSLCYLSLHIPRCGLVWRIVLGSVLWCIGPIGTLISRLQHGSAHCPKSRMNQLITFLSIVKPWKVFYNKIIMFKSRLFAVLWLFLMKKREKTNEISIASE